MTVVNAVRRRPGLILAFAVAKFAAAWVAALPIAAQVRATGVGQLAEGDGALFAPGGLMLAEVLMRHGRALGSAIETTFLLVCASWAVLLMPLTLLLVGLARPGKLSVSVHGVTWLESLPRVLVIGASALAAQAVMAFLGLLVLGAFVALTDASTPRVRGLALLGGMTVLTLPWLLLSSLRDLGFAATIGQRVGVLRALGLSFRTFTHRFGATLRAYAAFVLASLSLVTVAALTTDLVDVSRAGSSRWLAVLFIHQFASLGLVVARAAWLDRGLSLVSSWSPAPDGTRARSDATAVPSPDRGASSDAPATGSEAN